MDTFLGIYSRSSDKISVSHLPKSAPSPHNPESGSSPNHSRPHLQIDLNASQLEKFPCSCGCSDGNILVEHDYFEAVPSYITYMLMEDGDLENKSSMFHDISALQAEERSFYDVLGLKYPHSPDRKVNSHLHPDEKSTLSSSQDAFELPTFGTSCLIENGGSLNLSNSSKGTFQLLVPSSGSQFVSQSRGLKREVLKFLPIENSKKNSLTAGYSRGKKNQHQKDRDCSEEGWRNKNFTSCAEEESAETKILRDELLLCPGAKNIGLHV